MKLFERSMQTAFVVPSVLFSTTASTKGLVLQVLENNRHYSPVTGAVSFYPGQASVPYRLGNHALKGIGAFFYLAGDGLSQGWDLINQFASLLGNSSELILVKLIHRWQLTLIIQNRKWDCFCWISQRHMTVFILPFSCRNSETRAVPICSWWM